jgi:8-oxo-dGTP pyrophosphatase MutT (NUDIX family)
MRTLTQKTDAFQSLMYRYTPVKSSSPAPGRSDIYGAIISSNGKYALVQGRQTGKWSFPKGHVNRFETPFECVSREISEEIGMETLPRPICGLPLRIGYYYIFEIQNTFDMKPRDTSEIMNTGWYSLDEMKDLVLNIDAFTFLQRCNKTSNQLNRRQYTIQTTK